MLYVQMQHLSLKAGPSKKRQHWKKIRNRFIYFMRYSLIQISKLDQNIQKYIYSKYRSPLVFIKTLGTIMIQKRDNISWPKQHHITNRITWKRDDLTNDRQSTKIRIQLMHIWLLQEIMIVCNTKPKLYQKIQKYIFKRYYPCQKIHAFGKWLYISI